MIVVPCQKVIVVSSISVRRTKALAAYQQQAVCVTRLVREVKTLREQVRLISNSSFEDILWNI